MKTILILVVIFVAFSDTLTKPQDFETSQTLPLSNIVKREIENQVNAFRGQVAEFDPLHRGREEFTFLGFLGRLDNIHIEGFSNVIVSRNDVDLFRRKADIAITFPRTTASIEHWLIKGLTFSREGSASISFEDLQLKATLNFSILSGKVTNVGGATLSVANVSVLIDGIFSNKQANQNASNAIGTFLYNFINNNKDFHKEINAALEKLLIR